MARTHEVVPLGSAMMDDVAALLCLESLEKSWFVDVIHPQGGWWFDRAVRDLNRKCRGVHHELRDNTGERGGGR